MHMRFWTVLASISILLPLNVVAQSRYDNPVDKKTYETSGQFKTYQPAMPRDTDGQRVTTRNIMLLTGEPDIKNRVKVEELAAYIKSAEVRAYVELMKNKAAMAALVQFNCQSEKCEVKMASQGLAEDATLQALYDAFSRLPPLKVTGEVAFQILFNVDS
jgi:hypothetical protein